MKCIYNKGRYLMLGLILLMLSYLATYIPITSIKAASNNLDTLKKELKLNIKTITDDTQPTITFINPSDSPINIQVDDQAFENAKSPFKLPPLLIGEHTVVFTYTNAAGVNREIALNIMVVPKAPIIKTKQEVFIKPDPVVIEGTALANAQVLVIVNSDQTHLIDVDENGTWQFVLNETALGTYNILVYTYKKGLISLTPDKIQIQYRLTKDDNPEEAIISTNNNKNTPFYKNIQQQIIQLKQNNPKQFMLWIGAVSTVIVLYLLFKLKQVLQDRYESRTIEELLLGRQNDKPRHTKQHSTEDSAPLTKDTTLQETQSTEKTTIQDKNLNTSAPAIDNQTSVSSPTKDRKTTPPKDATKSKRVSKSKSKKKKAKRKSSSKKTSKAKSTPKIVVKKGKHLEL